MIGQDFERLELVLRLIAHLDRRLGTMSREAFLADLDEVDLTAFRLSAIGETTNKLSAALKLRHPHIPWEKIYGMRNLITHDYGAIVPERLWAAFTDGLDDLAAICCAELAGEG